jgi:hypothetical protein
MSYKEVFIMEDNTNKATNMDNNNDGNNNSQEPVKAEDFVSTKEAVKSLAHNAGVQVKRFGKWLKPKAKKAAIAVGVVAGVAVAANEISKRTGNNVPELEADDVDAIDTVVQLNEDGSVVVTPELGSETENETTEE